MVGFGLGAQCGRLTLARVIECNGDALQDKIKVDGHDVLTRRYWIEF